MNKFYLIGSAAFLLSACGSSDADKSSQLSAETFAASFQEMLLDAKPGDVIDIPAGKHSFEKGLSLRINNVTLRGAGINKTILTFKDQIAGAEGLLVNADDFTIENLAIEDSIGDALKVNECKNVSIKSVRTEWTGGYKTENGAYGIYPVQCENVLIENSVAIGASDAGIYVGQSRNIIVRNNRVEYNVAGIEVENSFYADVYDNIATNNTGGILVFNMPNLPQDGHSTRVYDNKVFENNTENFGHEGTPVASVPAGSGIVINSNDKVEIFNNEIRDNRTANIIISSVYSTGYNDGSSAAGFDPFPEGIFIYNNALSGGGNAPDTGELALLKTVMFGANESFPDILWDGFVNPSKLADGIVASENRICVQNGDIQMLNADGPNMFASPTVVEAAALDCTHPKLKAVKL